MKQQDAFRIIIAGFLALTMVLSIFAYFPRSGNTQDIDETVYQQEKYNPEFWVINEPFDSISDALNMTPPGALSARYADLESMTPQMLQWARGLKVDLVNAPIIYFTDFIYKSNTTRMYYARILHDKNDSFLLLSTMFPEKNDFEYISDPDTPVLIRQEQGISGIYNIMGTPAIFAPPQTAGDVWKIINSLNKTNTSYDRFGTLLSRVKPAPYQFVSSNVSFAEQYYMGMGINNGSYERTSVYLDINSSALKKLEKIKTNATQSGVLQYNITRSGNFTLVTVVSKDLWRVLPVPEEAS